jgi:tRNA 2-thiocytidine biosynthesis protein TtcA
MKLTALAHIERTITRKTGQAIGDFSLIQDGDKIMVALSGGKDSWTLLHVLKKLRKKAPVDFDLLVVTVDPGFEGYDTGSIQAYMGEQYPDLQFLLYRSNIYQIIQQHKTPNKGFCSFCARLRRGILYTLAKQHGVTKVALAHTADDLIETLLLNQFFSGTIKSMSPLLHADDGINTLIRPLCYVEEALVSTFVELMDFPVVDTPCPVKNNRDMKRAMVKQLLAELEKRYPGVKSSMLHALACVDGRHLLDKRLGEILLSGRSAGK